MAELPQIPPLAPLCRNLRHHGDRYECALGGRCEPAYADPGKLNTCTRGFARVFRAGEQDRELVKSLRAPVPCVHLGDDTGNEVPCAEGCQGVRLKTFRCGVHGACTPEKKGVGIGACCKGCPDRQELRWVTTKQLAEDSVRLASMLPADTARIMAIPRSGLIPGAIVATQLHLPLYAFDGTAQGKLLHGNSRGWTQRDGPTVVIDDTVYAGHAISRVRTAMARESRKPLYAAVYVHPPSVGLVDFYVRPDTGIFLEWNFFSNYWIRGWGGMATDFDGVLCHDPTIPDADDGPALERYQRWLTAAKPLHLPRAEPVRLIVTARLERFRGETEAWLRRYGVRWDRLVMCPVTKASQRGDVAAFKAQHYRDSPTGFFVESDPTQAQRIFELTGKQVICPGAAKVWR